MEDTTRRITSGSGLTLGRTDASVSIELAEPVREEIQKLRMHYIDTEQILALRAWQAANPGDEPHALALADWRIAAMEKWEAEHPQLSALLFPAAAKAVRHE